MTKTIFHTLCALALLLVPATALSGQIDDVRKALEQSSISQVQEKVYLHTDNQCYFVGDTLWYKAYVVRADNHRPTDMSRLLYVELLSPDGLVVERQQIIVSPQGHTCGQFALRDSLYSGYYELRAYTRWMLNFNVREHRYSLHDTWVFYNRQMAADYYRVWDGLYSRVLPIYSKPEEPGDYDARRMYQRPKTRLPKQKKDDLVVTFFPEGGHLIEGLPNRVAFEVQDQHGEAVGISGTVSAADGTSIGISTEYMGRGAFMVKPGAARLSAHFSWRGKDYTIDLPKAEKTGATLRLDGNTLTISAAGLDNGHDHAVSVLCRGVLKHFSQVDLTTGTATLQLPLDELPSGVADVTLFDDEARVVADRLFFVNHETPASNLITTTAAPTTTYEPYQRVSVPLQCQGVSEPTTISVSIRDSGTDEPTYDDGNLLTSMLLSSELRGFIAHPAHYFEADDDVHRRHLDLLMMVQGWRKYNWQELADTTRRMRYQPEVTLTFEGNVYKMLSLNEVEPDEIERWQDGVGMLARKTDGSEDYVDPWADEQETDLIEVTATTGLDDLAEQISNIDYVDIGDANQQLGVNHGNLKHEVLVEAEMVIGDQIVGEVQKTQQRGHFLFQVPPFYGDAYMNIKAYKESDSVKMNMASRKDAKALDERAFPDFYVKRDVFFPMFTHDYTFYEKHQPDYDAEMLIDTLSELSMENDVHQLADVKVKGHRRGRRAIDWHKPAFVMDAYELYNDITDRGLSFGKLDMRQFPVQVCHYLYGNMNRYNRYNVDGRIDGAVYYRNYSPLSPGASLAEQAGQFRANRTPQLLYNMLQLKRLQDVRVFSDYEPRTEDSTMVESRIVADATVDLVLIPDGGVQPTFRDRHLVFHGVNFAEQFYQPDYSQRPADSKPADYRRTLYWNPNAVTDSEGRFTATFFTAGKEARIKVSAAGVTSDGRLLHSK
ncbi:MAG: hypothetical protein IJ612_02915 [Prevotella sp.]|nr:hypothetical protein [Prevotella sp.]